MTRLLIPVLASALWACGGPQAGEACNQQGFLCADSTAAIECKNAVWTAVPCRGPAGCQNQNGQITCDLTGSQPGDLCASTAEGKGICAAAGNALLECRSGAWAQSKTCTSCATSNDEVKCTQ